MRRAPQPKAVSHVIVSGSSNPNTSTSSGTRCGAQPSARSSSTPRQTPGGVPFGGFTRTQNARLSSAAARHPSAV